MTSPFEPTCTLEEIRRNGMAVFSLSFGQVLVCATEEGIYAIKDLCPHEEVPLSRGCLVGNTIRCALHGSRFDLESGEPLEEPADAPLVRHPVRVVDDRIWVGPA